jgi:phosphoglycolate phosphatase
MNAPGLLVWDLDGTLVDSREDIATAANAALQAIGRPTLPVSAVVVFVGDGIDALIERLTPGGDAAERARCLAAFKTAYVAGCCQATAAYPGIADALAELSAAGWIHAVATNKAGAYVQPILTHCGIFQHFAACRGGDGIRKPDPWMLHDLSRELALPVRWMIGDHHTDIRAGQAAGCRVLFCAWGLGQRDGLATDAEARTPAEVARAIAAFPRA